MTDLKDTLTSNAPLKEEIDFYEKELIKTSDELIKSIPDLFKLSEEIKNGNSVDFEIRSVNIALPQKFWNCFDRIISILSLRETLNIKHPDERDEIIQDNIFNVFKEAYPELTLSQVMISEFTMDNVLDFCLTIEKTSLIKNIQEAIISGDREKIKALIKSETGEDYDFKLDDEFDFTKN